MTSRSGAALIMAIVILAAMLLLGLPFLFTQSSSLSGTRSYSHGRLASIGQDSAQSMGTAAGTQAMSYRWQRMEVPYGDTATQPIDDWTSLFFSLGGDRPNSGLYRDSTGKRNRIDFDTRYEGFVIPGDKFLEGLPAAERDLLLQRYPTTVGLAIEDESGKLDPNYLSVNGWSRLLAAVGIGDWTSGQIPATDPGRLQLARALSTLRYQLLGHRITSLDQLLQAEPPTNVTHPRRALTRAELNRLRPYLTLHNLAQARGGLIDLGTVIGINGSQITFDHVAPEKLVAYPATPHLHGTGTTLIVSNPDDGIADPHGRVFAMPASGETARFPRVEAAVAIDVPPTVNIHQMDDAVRTTYAFGPLPAPRQPTPPSSANPTDPTPAPQPALVTELINFDFAKQDERSTCTICCHLYSSMNVVAQPVCWHHNPSIWDYLRSTRPT
jgi:hypothetical protein